MAIVGEAHIIVRALTDKVAGDIKRGFNGTDRAGQDAGRSLAQKFQDGFNRNTSNNIFGKVQDGLRGMNRDAEREAQQFHALMRKGFAMQSAIGSLIGGISSVIGALGALVGSAGQAGASLVVVGNGMFAAVSAMSVAKAAFHGIGGAISAYNKQQNSAGTASTNSGAAAAAAAQRIQQAEQALARVIQTNREQLTAANNQVRDAQLALNKAIVQGQEDLQQLGFDAEDAALAEKQSALDLQDARDKLAATADLPPNSRARQEAELAYQEADLAYRRAKDRNADTAKEEDAAAQKGVAGTQVYVDAQKNLADAVSARSKTVRDGAQQEADAVQNLADARKAAANADAGGGGGGAKDPFAGLNAAQKTFALFLIGLQPKLKALRAAAANSLLPPLQDAITLLMSPNGLYGTVLAGVPIIGRAMGAAANSIASALNDPGTLSNIEKLFVSSGKLITNFGAGLGNYIGAFSTILRAAIPLAERFSGFLLQQSKNFSAFIDKLDRSGQLTAFFNQAGDTMAKFGTIIGNVLSGFGAIIRANMGPGTGGQMLLDFFVQGSKGMRDLNSATGQLKLKEYFSDTAKNAMPILSLLKQIGGAFLGLGKDQNIGRTFTILQGAVGPLTDIAKAGIDAGPAMASVVVQIAKLIRVFAGDSGAPKAFFETLGGILSVVLGFVSQPAVSGFINWFGTLTARVSAFTFTAILAGKAISILFGSVSLILTPFKLLLNFLSPLLTVGKFLFTAFGPLARIFLQLFNVTRIGTAVMAAFNLVMDANPIALIVIAIAALVAGLIWFFTQTKVGQDIWANFTKFLGEAWNNVVGAIGDLLNNLGSYFTAVWTFIQAGIAGFIAVVQGYFNTLFAFWSGIWNVFFTIVSAVWNTIIGVISSVIGFIVTYVQAYLTLLFTIWSSIWNGIFTTVIGVWNSIQTFIASAIAAVQTIINNVLGLIVAIFTGHWNEIPKYLAGIWNGIRSLVQAGLNFVRNIIGSVLGGIRTVWNGIWGGISGFFHTIWNGIVKTVQSVGGVFSRAFGAVAKAIRDAFNGVFSAVKGTINALVDIANHAIDGLNKLKFKIPAFFPPPFGGATLGVNIPHIPRLATGGVVMPSAGGSIVNVAEAGRPERIEPLDAQGLSARDRAIIAQLSDNRGGSQVTLNLYPPAGASNADIAAMVNQEIAFQMRKGTI